ncbi:MAG: AAA family ATPase, partial [Alphaproteobacteria bacterium]|nr:AAA family ATPase [Alphaproteobacteria bacterium]
MNGFLKIRKLNRVGLNSKRADSAARQAHIHVIEIEGGFVVPATIQVAGAEIELVSAMSRENRLKSMVHEIKTDFDIIVIDCPPSLGL